VDRISKNDLILQYQNEFKDHFETQDYYTAIAPGRINIIGEHTDYNLGLAMPIGINRWICSIVSLRDDDRFNIYSSNFNEKVSVDFDELKDNVIDNWKKYVFGCIKIFMDEYSIDKGVNILIGGNIPIGFGMSSSAALEVSILSSLSLSFNKTIEEYKILELSHKVENDFLGIKSGLLDQYASVFSKKDKPLCIDFASMTHSYVNSNIIGATWLLINSMVDRSLINSKYNDRVNECRQALVYINETFKDIRMNELTKEHLEVLVNKKELYNRIAHIVSENKRVVHMKEALVNGDNNLIGKILNKSHDSLKNYYNVSCREIDSIIDISRQLEGFYGGRIMGGGFGGCCLVLIDSSKSELFTQSVTKLFFNKYQYNIKIENIDFANGLEYS